MVAWKKTILFQYIYVTILLGISLIFVCAEEVQNVSEFSQALPNTELNFGYNQGQALVESNIRFPTIGSFFSWLGSFNSLYVKYERTFEEIATSIPPKEDLESQITLMTTYSFLLQCLKTMGELNSIYEASILETNSDMLSDDSSSSVSNLLKECLIPFKDLLLKSFIALQDQAFDSGKTYSPALFKSSELIMELYEICWSIFTTILGYITMFQQSMNILLRNRSENQEKLKFLENKQEKSSLEQLQSNIYTRRLVDISREEKLISLVLTLFEGDFSVSINILELESLITTENKRSISELEESIKNLEKSIKCDVNSEENSNMLLVKALKEELDSRTNDLVRQTSGPPIYLQRYDQELTEIFTKLNLEGSQSDSTNEQNEADDETKVKVEEADPKEVQ
ncbi:putative signal peptide-containing protein [Cryptosporidium parvum]